MRRAKEWDDRGFEETLVDFAALNARSKFWVDDQRAALKNWEEQADLRKAGNCASGICPTHFPPRPGSRGR
jgi:hypothetical protein